MKPHQPEMSLGFLPDHSEERASGTRGLHPRGTREAQERKQRNCLRSRCAELVSQLHHTLPNWLPQTFCLGREHTPQVSCTPSEDLSGHSSTLFSAAYAELPVMMVSFETQGVRTVELSSCLPITHRQWCVQACWARHYGKTDPAGLRFASEYKQESQCPCQRSVSESDSRPNSQGWKGGGSAVPGPSTWG